MRTNIRSAELLHKIKVAHELQTMALSTMPTSNKKAHIKIAENMISDYVTDNAHVNDEIYQDVEDMGAQANDLSDLGYYDENYFNGVSPDLNWEDLNAMDLEGLGLGAGALNLYDDIYNVKESSEHSTEKVAEMLNEVVKIGRINHVIKHLRATEKEANVKMAQELDLINKNYLVNVLYDVL